MLFIVIHDSTSYVRPDVERHATGARRYDHDPYIELHAVSAWMTEPSYLEIIYLQSTLLFHHATAPTNRMRKIPLYLPLPLNIDFGLL